MPVVTKFYQQRISVLTRILIRTVFFCAVLCLVFIFSNEIFSWAVANCKIPYSLLEPRGKTLLLGILIGLFQTICLGLFAGFFKGMLRYFRIQDAVRIAIVLFGAFLVLFSITPLFPEVFQISRRLLCGNLLFSIFGIWAVRGVLRMLWETKSNALYSGEENFRRVAIFGAGDAGASVASTFLSKRSLKKRAVVFFDDDLKKKGLSILGIPVVGKLTNIKYFQDRYNFKELIIAIPSAKLERIRELRKQATDAGIEVTLIPGIEELSRGEVNVSSIRHFEIQDLLDRPPLNLNDAAINEMLGGKTVLVTGAGGSIGSEICRQVAKCAPARLLLVEQCEVLLYQIEQDLISQGARDCIVPIIADIVDIPRIESVFEKFHPDIVFHAAAHKHVPMMELHPGEAIKNNSLGSIGLCKVAQKYKAEAFVMISTDKAINPTNAMGASKRLAEIMLQSFSQNPDNTTRFMAVRFGNVLGSSGSVIPLFKKQIEQGGPLTVTHQDIKRYFMTIPEACGLVLQTATIGKNGSIYVLDMGEPVKIIDVAHHLIELSGLRPNIDIKIQITGLRPGEKLFEELKSKGEDYEPSGHPRISRFKCEPFPLDKLEKLVDDLKQIVQLPERNDIKNGIQKHVPEYKPYLD